jgi:hypothetical protein
MRPTTSDLPRSILAPLGARQPAHYAPVAPRHPSLRRTSAPNGKGKPAVRLRCAPPYATQLHLKSALYAFWPQNAFDRPNSFGPASERAGVRVGRGWESGSRVRRAFGSDAGPVGGTMRAMAVSPTTTVEIDTELLERLRRRRPAKSDRELLESVARIQLGREASDRARERFRGVPSEEIEREALSAVREVRSERAAARRAI